MYGMQNSQNKIVIAIIVVGVLFIGIYIVGQQQVKKSVDSLEMEFNDFKVDKLSILPPEIDLTLTYKVNNPSNLPLKVSLDGEVYYGTTKITPVTVKERMIPAMGSGYIDAQISLNGTLLQAIGDPQNEGNYKLEGTLTVTVQYLGVIPVNVKLDLAELES
jgi:LEA14-like dessication related protein